MNRDSNGIIGQIQADGSIEGGDSACWNGHWLYLNDGKDPGGNVVTDVESYVDFFEVEPGAYVRHPVPSESINRFGAYYKNPWNGCISRDQLTGILAALNKHDKPGPILRLMLHHSLKLFLFTYNTVRNGQDPETAEWKMPDITLMDIWALELRALGNAVRWLKPILYPVLTILDIHMLLNTLYFNYFNKDEDNINHAIKLIIGKENNPTIISKLTFKLCNKIKLINTIKSYWCNWRDNCNFAPMYEKKLV